MIKIIDNKKIEMTQDEYDMYLSIAKSYDRPNFKGANLFYNLFESDDNGIILFLKPPSERHTSLEVIVFLQIIQQQQQLRLMKSKFDQMCKDFLAQQDNLLSSKKIK